MALENSIDRLLGGKKMSMDRAHRIYEALARQDDEYLRPLMYAGYVYFDNSEDEQMYHISPEWALAYTHALSGYWASQERRAKKQRSRASTMRSLGMRRTRSGSWE
jgi:hypothetical protein